MVIGCRVLNTEVLNQFYTLCYNEGRMVRSGLDMVSGWPDRKRL